MNNKGLEELILRIEEDFNQLAASVDELKQELEAALEENNRLRIMNQDLRAMGNETVQLEQEKAQTQAQDSKAPRQQQSAQSRLQTFYDEGVHICHQHFGERRDLEDGCLFCLAVLDSLSNNKRSVDA